MAKCAYCRSTILFGGVTDNDLRFCNDDCHQQGYHAVIADQVPDDVVYREVMAVHRGMCPNCNGNGPIDVHTSYTVWSALLLTSWQSKPRVSCRACGFKAKLGAIAFSGVLGWWGIPWGLIFTPVQLGRNLIGLFSNPDPTKPSDQLDNIIRLGLAKQLVDAHQQSRTEAASAP